MTVYHLSLRLKKSAFFVMFLSNICNISGLWWRRKRMLRYLNMHSLYCFWKTRSIDNYILFFHFNIILDLQKSYKNRQGFPEYFPQISHFTTVILSLYHSFSIFNLCVCVFIYNVIFFRVSCSRCCFNLKYLSVYFFANKDLSCIITVKLSMATHIKLFSSL